MLGCVVDEWDGKRIILVHLWLCLGRWLIGYVGEIWHVGDILVDGIVVTLIFIIFVATTGIISKTSSCAWNKSILILRRGLRHGCICGRWLSGRIDILGNVCRWWR